MSRRSQQQIEYDASEHAEFVALHERALTEHAYAVGTRCAQAGLHVAMHTFHPPFMQEAYLKGYASVVA